MRARLIVLDDDGATERGVLPTVKGTLRFSSEVGGAGRVDFTALQADLETLAAWDALARLDIQVAPPAGSWTPIALYALRPPHTWDRVGKPLVACQGLAVLEQLASETLVWPEYAATTMPRGAGTDVGIGWMSSYYLPAEDPREPWDGCYTTARSAMPPDFPTGSGADWISVHDATDESERKYFRATLTLTAARRVKLWFHADESATVYVAGEPVIDWSGAESTWDGAVWDDPTATYVMVMEAGEYAVGVTTDSVWSTGGDGVDPILCAVAALDDDGGVDEWLLVTNDTDWVACRRDADPPDNDPPGPTPGAALAALHGMAVERAVTGWPAVSLGFDADRDSYGQPWPEQMVERLARYGSDTYWALWQGWADADEVDVWMGAGLVLHAAPVQGVDRTATLAALGTSDIATMNATRGADPGTHVVALGLDGWVEASTGGPRREYGLEVGTAISRAVAQRVANASIAEVGRWDGSARLAPQCSAVPGVDFGPGDTLALAYPGAPASARVLSVSAQSGEGGLLWDVELVVGGDGS